MVGPWLVKPYTFRALRKTYGPLWLRCDVCRRYVPLKIGGLQNVDYRTETFSCSKCGAAAYVAIIEPIKETGMEDYRLDETGPRGIQTEPQSVDKPQSVERKANGSIQHPRQERRPYA